MTALNNKKYISYLKYDVISGFLGALVWISLITFTIVTKGLLGVETITLLESLVFLFGMIGVYLAYSKFYSLKSVLLIDILLETIFLIVILYLIYIKSNYIAVAIYFVIILGGLLRPAISEKHRNYQDSILRRSSSKRLLSMVRKRDQFYEKLAGVLGSLLAVIAVTVIDIDLYTFATMMLILNVLQNSYDYYKWYVFIK